VTRASLKVVAADTETVSGKKSGRVLVDEHWIFGKRANAEAMFMEALGGQVSRNEGWVIFLSTQSDEAPAGVFKQKLDYFRDVRDGKLSDPKSLGVLYEFPPDMVKAKAYLEPTNYHVTNPNIGRSVSREWLEDQLRKVQGRTDGALQQFLAKHLNVEIGLNLRSDRWAGADFWEAAAVLVFSLTELIERCEVATVGIDGGGLDDLLGLCVIGRERGTGRWLAWCHAWAHPSVLERRKSEAPRFQDFARDGDLTLVEHIGQDVDEVAELVSQVADAGLLDREQGEQQGAIGADPVGVGAILDALEAAGIEKEQVVAVSQGWRLAGAIKTAERRIAEMQIVHAGRPLMAWCVGNARVEQRANSILITKQASGTAKIDPLMAMFNAVHLMSLNPASKGKSFWETEEETA
jgi:phage terminase large subunit-like protein